MRKQPGETRPQNAHSQSDRSETDLIRGEFDAARRTLDAFVADEANLRKIARAARIIATAFTEGNKVLSCGNGGSSADALHFCEEFTGRYRHNRPAYPAIACIDPGHLTCTANDFGYDNVFSRWTEAFAQRGDVLVVLSTSGNSENVIRAVDVAKSRGTHTFALLGKGGGRLKGMCDIEWIVPGLTDASGKPEVQYADRIQEIHMLLLHVLICAVEKELDLLAPEQGSLQEVKPADKRSKAPAAVH